MLKKSLALLMTLCMVIALAPVSAFAVEPTSYNTVQIPAKLPGAVSLDGYITQGDGYHSFGIVADNVLTDIAENSKSKNYAMADVAEALNDAQTFTYFFAQDDTKYYFGIKLDRKSVNVNGYNYFSSQQDLTFNFGFGSDDNPVTINLPVRNNVSVGTSAHNLKVSDATIKGGFTCGVTSGKALSFFATEPTYYNAYIAANGAENGPGVWSAEMYSDRVKTDTRTVAEGTVIGLSAARAGIIGASVFTYEFSITKDSVKDYLKATEAPSSIYFSAASTTRYGSMNDLSLATMAGADSFDSTYSANIQFVSVDASNCEHTYVNNPIDSFLVNKSNWVSNAGYYGAVSPTTNNVVASRLRCGQAAEYYKSCSKCRTAGTDTFYGETKAHSFVVRGDIVSSEITACNVENPSRITYEYKCAWCDETKVLPLGDYIHNYEISDNKIQYSNRYYAKCDCNGDGEVDSFAAVFTCTSNHEIGTDTFKRTTDIAATCTTPAVTAYECAATKENAYCQYVATVKTADANGHTAVIEDTYDVSLTASEVDKAPTCEGEGVYFKTCRVCGVIDESGATFTTAPLTHDEATKQYGYNDDYHWFECDVCNGVDVAEEKHIFDIAEEKPEYLVEGSVATCIQGASYYKHCICGAISATETFEGSTDDISLHNYSEKYFYNELYHWKECTRCGATNMPTYHVLDGTSCTLCNYKKVSVPSTPITEAPATEAPTTEAPATEAPTTEAPATEAPTTEAPATEAPATEAPVTEAPATDDGCNGAISLAGLALVATLGTCTAFVAKKKED